MSTIFSEAVIIFVLVFVVVLVLARIQAGPRYKEPVFSEPEASRRTQSTASSAVPPKRRNIFQ